MVFLLTIFKKKANLFEEIPLIEDDKLPNVSFVISIYNEEKKIDKTIESLLAIDYPKNLFEIILVNDGSNDKTKEVVGRYTSNKNIIFIDNKKNKGKAVCLNQGISQAKGEFIACMDADSVVPKDILQKTLPFFKNKKTGAVTIPVEVKNPKNFLEKIIEIEYIIGLSLFLKVLSFFDSIHVTPGPFSIYRISLIKKLGGFDEKSMVEDLEIAYRIQKLGYKIDCCISTYVKTIIPNNLKSLYTQRKRWYSGSLLTLYKHRSIIFNKEVGFFGYFIPFSFALVVLGLSLFMASIYLGISNLVKQLSFYSLTNYNFLAHLSLTDIDLLNFSIFGFFGIFSIVATYFIAGVGLKIYKVRILERKLGFASFFLLFFLYQFFWLSSFSSVILARKIKWR
ncbi:glycosyltransferase family 2 protein [Candidatus Woesearchaeota archaeon]|nr:glycosyltransferase family 2 protein [Candidatus Woesearchaeota archaeon]